MKRFLVFILVVGLVFVGVGFWQGWFTTGGAGESGLSVSFHKDKLTGDWDKATDKVKELATSAWDAVKAKRSPSRRTASGSSYRCSSPSASRTLTRSSART